MIVDVHDVKSLSDKTPPFEHGPPRSIFDEETTSHLFLSLRWGFLNHFRSCKFFYLVINPFPFRPPPPLPHPRPKLHLIGK